MSDFDRIVIETPSADSSRHRVEPRMFEQLDAIRWAERSGVVALGDPPRRWPWLVAAGAFAAAAIVLVVVVFARGGTPAAPEHASAPSRVVTPTGGSSRFTIDDAVI